VTPPIVKRNKKPKIQNITGVKIKAAPDKEAIQEKILIPVGTAIIIVAAVK
jgi:hypothetical protein